MWHLGLNVTARTGKGNVFPVHAFKPRRMSRGVAPLLRNLCTRWGKWLTPCPGRCILGKWARTHWIEGWMGPRNVLDVLEKRKSSCSYRDLNPLSISYLLYLLRYSSSWHVLYLSKILSVRVESSIRQSNSSRHPCYYDVMASSKYFAGIMEDQNPIGPTIHLL